jgi:hypothetical protein
MAATEDSGRCAESVLQCLSLPKEVRLCLQLHWVDVATLSDIGS